MGCLIGVRREEPPSLKATFERDVDRRPRGLEPATGCGGLRQLAELCPGLVENQDVRRERVIRIESTANFHRILFVAYAGQAVSRLQHIYFESLGIAEKRDPRRKIQPRLKN